MTSTPSRRGVTLGLEKRPVQEPRRRKLHWSPLRARPLPLLAEGRLWAAREGWHGRVHCACTQARTHRHARARTCAHTHARATYTQSFARAYMHKQTSARPHIYSPTHPDTHALCEHQRQEGAIKQKRQSSDLIKKSKGCSSSAGKKSRI